MLTSSGSRSFFSSALSGCRASGRSTAAPPSSCGVTTMKMMRSTSTTSTRGVTFISGARTSRRADMVDFSLEERLAAAVVEPRALGVRADVADLVLHRVDELAAGLIEAEQDGLTARGEQVVGEHRGDRGEQAERRHHQR